MNLTKAPFLRHPTTFRLFVALCLLPALFLGIERLCHDVTDGFALTRITHPLLKDAEFAPPKFSHDEKKQLHTILSQPFHYLSCGGQTYVFISADHRYVIKFLKFHHRRIPGWIQALPLPPALAHYRSRKVQRKDFRLRRTLRSYVLAYNHLKEETGLIYHHLHHTQDLGESLILFDRLGYRYHLNLDEYAFLIQKKGVSTAEMLRQLMKEGQEQEAKEKLTALLHFAATRFQKGIHDRDFKFQSNLGFIDDIPAQIDLGSLSLDTHQMLPEVYKPALYEGARRFQRWLEQYYPSLVPSFEEELNTLISTPTP